MNHIFTPLKRLTESNSLSEFGDDDVDIEGRASGIDLSLNDSITWNETYTKGGPNGYEVLSDDSVDLERLRIYLVGSGSQFDVDLTFHFAGGGSSVHCYSGTASANNLTFSGEELGSFQGKKVSGFTIEATHIGGTTAPTISGFDLYWEAVNIEKG